MQFNLKVKEISKSKKQRIFLICINRVRKDISQFDQILIFFP